MLHSQQCLSSYRRMSGRHSGFDRFYAESYRALPSGSPSGCSSRQITQSLKDTMRDVDGWNNLTASQKEALDMIQHKIGRILNGDPTYDDSWKDIAGYATLIVNELNGYATLIVNELNGLAK